ncbi:MAG TPA: DUF3226 domain-containing protein [Saprospiraceae bacterium]|nr:DUF3226 domain-containing protein [Saprospiraceae bacterium]
MKKNIQIFVEGDADATFLVSFFLKKFNLFFEKATKQGSQDGKYIQHRYNDDNLSILIVPMGGYSKINLMSESMKKVYDYDGEIGINLVIQDADDPSKDHGSFIDRVKYLEEARAKLFKESMDKHGIGVTFHYYLFPYTDWDSSGQISGRDGDLETLLMSIVNQQLYKKFISCREAYVECLKTLCDTEHWKEHNQNKSIIYDYFQIYNGKDFAKEIKRDYNTHCWDLDHPDLTPLTNFLKKHIY